MPPQLHPVKTAIEMLCKDAKMKIKMGCKNRTIPHPAGTKQGDNMVPVPFVFLMQALSETLEKELERE